jgi:NADPH2:quinone reductase
MRAIQIATYGSPLELVDIPDPVAADGHEVVDVVYAGVNPLDVWVSRGNFAGVTPQPHTPGVEGVGRRADGSPVIVSGVGVATPGTYAERVAVPTESIVPVPAGVDLQQAAAISVAAVTAWMCVNGLAVVRAEDVVLVLGASGGVGGLAAQIARNAGATVIGQTSSPSKVEAIQALGATAVVAAEPADLRAALDGRAPTVVIDGLGGGFTGACVDLAAPGARIVNFGTSADTAVAFDMRTFYRKSLRLLGYGGLILTPTDRARAYESIFADIAAGRLRVTIDAVLPLRAAGEAHRRILDREVEGKLLLDPRATD